MRTIGLALGGGGAKGLAHIPLLEVFDELGLRPHRIASTSIGSVFGALYANGIPAKDIRDLVNNLVISKGDSLKDIFKKKDFFKAFEFFDIGFRRGAILKGDAFIQYLTEHMDATTFETLKIPLQIVATNYWTCDQVVLESGPLAPAIKASMGLPGIFHPVEIEGRILIDGGGVNPVPHDLLKSTCDYVVAIDVMGERSWGRKRIPRVIDAVMGTFDIMQKSLIAEKRKHTPPDAYIRPKLVNIDLLDFYKMNEIYEQTESACQELKAALETFISEEAKTATHKNGK